MRVANPDGAELLRILAALGNPHRLRIMSVLSRGRRYVSQLARELGMSRPLLHMHLQRLEAAGLVTGTLETGSDGKIMRYYQATEFAIELSPHTFATITIPQEDES